MTGHENEYVETALEACELAAEVQKEGFRKTREKEYKAPRDIVTEIDLESEEKIKEKLKSEYPDHSILGEETGQDIDADERWIVDPLDGTTNFFHGVPHFSVSIAYEVNDEIEAGVVYHTPTSDAYTAVKGEGAYLNGEHLSVSSAESLDESLISTGFAAESADEPNAFETLRKFVGDSHGVRRFGSAAYDLVNVANGVVEGFYEKHLNPWDIAAGSLIVKEAGGEVTDFNGEKDGKHIEKGEVVATNGEIHNEVLKRIEF